MMEVGCVNGVRRSCGGCHSCAVVCGAGAAEVGGAQRGCADLQWKAVLVVAAAGFAPAERNGGEKWRSCAREEERGCSFDLIKHYGLGSI